MKVILVIILSVLIFLSMVLAVWAAYPRLSPSPTNKRIKRSIGAGLGVIMFVMSSFLLYALFNDGTFSLAAIQGLCTALFCVVFWGIIATLSVFYQSQYSERMLRDGLDGLSKLVEPKPAKDKQNEKD